MASGDINLNLNVLDKGGTIKSRTQDAKELNKELDKAANRTTGTRSGSMAARRAGFQSPDSISDQEYNRGRGAAGVTGASARDFANQAQGLGGLVRLYATYAANVFAVSAAFEALRNSMATDIMIRSMDRLGASSGIALGGLAKQFAAASDGAISFREAAEAATKATSAGLSTKQFMELGVVAKGAAQALGLNMSDAISRLTRGITKLEPELLDELGIFTKIGPATEAYAKKVGKTADSLTDFERRQAFANAVLEEGRRKFAEAAGEANPYDKLLASLKDVAQTILSTVNTVIAPIAKILADNSQLIGLAIAAAAVKIVSTALPALAQWRGGLLNAAKAAKESAREINRSYGEAFVERYEARLNLPGIRSDIEKTKKEIAALDKDLVGTTALTARQKSSATFKAVRDGELLTARQITAAEKTIEQQLAKNTDASTRYATALRSRIDAQKRLVDLQKQEISLGNRVVDIATEQPGFFSGTGSRERIAARTTARAEYLGLVSGVGDLVQEKGLGALGGFYKEVDSNKNLGRFDKFKAKAVGTFAGIATEAAILGRSLAGVFNGIGIALTAFALLDPLLSKNSKEASEFSGSVDSLSEAVKTSIDVNNKWQYTLSIESINARANAFNNLADGITNLTINLLRADQAASGWDKFIDGFKIPFGADLKTSFEKSLAAGVDGAIKALPAGEYQDDLKEKLQTILNVDDLSVGTVAEALRQLSPEQILRVGSAIGTAVDLSNKKIKDLQATTQDFKDTSKGVDDSLLALRNSLQEKGPLNSFLDAGLKQAVALQRTLKDTVSAQAVFKSIVSGETRLQLVDPQAAQGIANLARESSALTDKASRYNKELTTTNGKIAEIDKQLQQYNIPVDQITESVAAYESAAVSALKTQRNQLLAAKNDTVSALSGINDQIKRIAESASKLVRDAISTQVDSALAIASTRLAQIANQGKSNIAQKLPVETKQTIDLQAKLAKEAIDLDERMFTLQTSMVKSMDNLAIQLEKNRITEVNRQLEQGLEKMPGDAILSRELTANKIKLAELDKVSRIYMSGAPTNANINALKAFAKENPQYLGLVNTMSAEQVGRAGFATRRQQLDVDTDIRQITNKYSGLIEQSAIVIKELETRKGLLETNTPQDLQGISNLRQEIAQERARQEQLQIKRDQDITARVGAGIGKGANVQSAVQEALARTGIRLGASQAAAGGEEQVAQAKDTRAIGLQALSEQTTIARNARATELEKLALTAQKSKDNIDLEKEQIDQLKQRGTISETAAARELLLLDTKAAAIEQVLALERARDQFLRSQEDYNKKLLESGGVQTEELKSEEEAYKATYKTAVDGANSAYAARVRLNSVKMTGLDEDSKKIDAIKDRFEQAFVGIGDKIEEFVRTGKTSFKDLFQSLLSDLIKMELRWQMSSMWKLMKGDKDIGSSPLSMGFDWLKGFLNKGSAAAASTSSMDLAGGSADLLMAKGGAFDYAMPVNKFAQGGTFTNSIVSSPTLFKFAQGTGLMGEAGPEAIMPLTRDSSGTLGVRAQSANQPAPKVDVVVINNSKDKAETKETTDSRGNRRIEVIVGDMVSGEMSRPGSATQSAMRSNFNLTPALVRR
jgi:lambda family phage tail tape measure protein